MSVPADRLLDRLTDSGLVSDGDLHALRDWAERTRPDANQLAQEVVGRGLLTRFQLREVAAGRAAGLTLGPYRLLDLLGEGGMGQVFRAHHTRLGREVAVKRIRPERLVRAVAVSRFVHEIQAAARLQHPNVVLAFDADEADGVPYYAMEFVPGADLGRVLAERGPLPAAEACGYIRQAADGLQHAADLGLVHRDVKPTNLLVTPDGQVKVLDLGLALLVADPASGAPSKADAVVGSPEYMAPEQGRQSAAVDTRADVYALGCTLFFLLTGRPPFGGDSQTDKVLRHFSEPVPSVLVDRPDVPPGLDAVVRWMLAKDPAARPQSMAAVAAALAPFAPGLADLADQSSKTEPLFADIAESAAVARPARSPRPSSGRRWFILAGLVGLVAAVGGLVWAFRGGGTGVPMPAEFINPVGMKLVWIERGTFTMGSPPTEPGRAPDETFRPDTAVGPFYVGTNEVTHGQFHAVMGRSPARWPGKMRDARSVPVDSVTWAEATEFCRRLSERDARRANGWSYRLPTEAEWEYAARGGTTTPFWAGDRLRFGATAVYDPDADDPAGLGEPVGKGVEKGLPHPVGSTLANPFGLHDTAGNVWEWAAEGVLRGGSWREPPARCRSAARRPVDPATRADDVGFRVVFASGS